MDSVGSRIFNEIEVVRTGEFEIFEGFEYEYVEVIHKGSGSHILNLVVDSDGESDHFKLHFLWGIVCDNMLLSDDDDDLTPLGQFAKNRVVALRLIIGDGYVDLSDYIYDQMN